MHKHFLTLLVVIVASLCIAGAIYDGVTIDETIYLGTGNALVQYHAVHLNCFHPILVKFLVGITTRFVQTHTIPSELFNDVNNTTLSYSHVWLTANADVFLSLVFVGRVTVILLNSLLFFHLLHLIKKWWGDAPAQITGVLLAFSPLFLANARYVALDVSCSLLGSIALMYLAEHVAKGCKKTFFYSTSWLFLCLLSKFQNLVIVPAMCGAILSISIFKTSTFSRSIRLFFAPLVTAFVCIALLYNYLLLSAPYGHQNIYQERLLAEGSPVFYQMVKMMTPYPILNGVRWYMTGAVSNLNLTDRVKPMTVLLGDQQYIGGKAVYFPFLIVMKETVASLVLISLSIIIGVFHRRKLEALFRNMTTEKQLFLLSSVLFVVIYLLFALNSTLNIGLRHILPVYPFVVLLVSLVMHLLLEGGKKGFFGSILAIVLSLHVIEALSQYPHLLAFRNYFAYGTYGDAVILSDSNFDWGQDSLRLHRRLEALKIYKVFQKITTSVDPNLYGKEVLYTEMDINKSSEIPSQEYYAVALQFLEKYRRTTMPEISLDACIERLGFRKVEQIGETIAFLQKK